VALGLEEAESEVLGEEVGGGVREKEAVVDGEAETLGDAVGVEVRLTLPVTAGEAELLRVPPPPPPPRTLGEMLTVPGRVPVPKAVLEPLRAGVSVEIFLSPPPEVRLRVGVCVKVRWTEEEMEELGDSEGTAEALAELVKSKDCVAKSEGWEDADGEPVENIVKVSVAMEEAEALMVSSALVL
jgi:hypothetical protein